MALHIMASWFEYFAWREKDAELIHIFIPSRVMSNASESQEMGHTTKSREHNSSDAVIEAIKNATLLHDPW